MRARSPFLVSLTINLTILFALIATAAVIPGDAEEPRTLVERSIKKFNDMRRPASAGRDEAEGYYEDLFQQSSRAVSVSALVSGNWAAKWTSWEFTLMRKGTTRRRSDFLYFELMPNVDVPERAGRLVTNSFGLADREYTKAPPPGIRRVAFIGDSMTRGMGSTPGANYESLLENWFNETRPNPEVNGYEFLNFGVEGYRLTQMVEVVHTKAADFSPDCYVVGLSDLGVARKWADHIWQLVNEGIDLEYDFLKNIVRRARLRPSDDVITMESKLAPYRLEILRWALQTIRAEATAQGAATIVTLVPQAVDVTGQVAAFEGIGELTRSLGIPSIDLLDTFEGVEDFLPLRASSGDTHPSDLGHRRLFERFRVRLAANPPAMQCLAGTTTLSSQNAFR